SSARGRPDTAGVVDLASGKSQPLVDATNGSITMPRFSPDGKWVCFTEILEGRKRRIYVAPSRGALPIPEKDWIVVVDGAELERQPYWPHDSDTIYFLSERDGLRCVWAQRLDPLTRRPSGAVFDVAHFHDPRRTPMMVEDTALIGLSLAGKRMFLTMAEVEGSIWMGEFVSPGK
ncbi:MAG: TolB family protein, partial [Bryobacteraceae bacterium]